MREILFRGKVANGKRKGEWAYGNLLQVSYGDKKYYRINGTNKNCNVDPDTIGQYIGVEDRYGNKVFEGDILSDERFNLAGNEHIRIYDNFIVEWNKKELRFEAKYLTDNFKQMRSAELLSDVKVKYIFERIGNKWDNPELLEIQK